MSRAKSHILKQLFDVRPMTTAGDLHWDKISRVKKHLNLRTIYEKPAQKIKLEPHRAESFLPDGRSAKEVFAPILANYYQPKNKSDKLQETILAQDRYLKEQQRKKILSDLEMHLAGEHVSPSHNVPIRKAEAGSEREIAAGFTLAMTQKKNAISKKPAKYFIGGFLTVISFLLAGGAVLFFNYQGMSVSKNKLPAAGLAVIEKNEKNAAMQANAKIPEYASEILNLLDGNRDQNILILFQNPEKIRATGGFIEKYGVATINDGKIAKITTDNIFNLDGQLREKIIPPLPLQEIATAWSAHDANWFLDFPTSARKAAQFYEIASGQRVSAVVALNPFALEKLLAISGTFEGIFTDAKNLPKIVSALEESAKIKDAMFYFVDSKAQEIISSNGFDGAILNSKNDYLAVAISNISGDTTSDKKILSGNINLKSEVAGDGQITNTLTIEYPANIGADFARVYAPKGARLIDVKGQAFKNIKAPIDYQKSGFENDRDVSQIESSLVVDKKTGTYIYEESGKTVFANWVDANSKNTVKIIYKYILPVKYNFDGDYQMIFQKQSGAQMKLNWQIDFPNDKKIIQSDFNQDLVINL